MTQIPPGLRTQWTLDGLEIDLAAPPHRRPSSGSTTPVLVTVVLMSVSLAYFGLVIGSVPCMVGFALPAVVAMLMLMGFPRKTQSAPAHTQRLVIGPQTLRVNDGTLDLIVPLREVLAVYVREGADFGLTMSISVRDQPAIELPMAWEPTQHARWIARHLEARANAVRSSGGEDDIPESLRQLHNHDTRS